jgi:hypothetical protein
MFVVLQLVVDVGKIGNRVRRPPDGDRTLAKQRLLQLDVVPVGYLRPTLSRRFRCFEILVNCTLRDLLPERAVNLPNHALLSLRGAHNPRVNIIAAIEIFR